jgi:hypothetical protein
MLRGFRHWDSASVQMQDPPSIVGKDDKHEQDPAVSVRA